MFNHPGRSLKTFATSLFWIISITFSGFWLYNYVDKLRLYWDYLEDAPTEFVLEVIFSPILVYAFTILLMVLCALLLCSIGEAANKSAENAYYARMILEKMNDSEKSPKYIPDVIANSVSEQSSAQVPETPVEPKPEPKPEPEPEPSDDFEKAQPDTPENTHGASAKFCIICGKKVPSVAAFCPDCGNKF